MHAKPSLALAFALATSFGWAGLAQAQQGAVLPLSPADQAALAANLGGGVIGAAVPASVIDAPAAYAGLGGSSWTYQFTSGANQGGMQTATLSPTTQWGASYALRRGSASTVYIQQTADGGLVATAEAVPAQSVVIQYSPPMPIVLAGMTPGQSTQRTIAINVYSQGNLGSPEYTGQVNLTYTYLGAYQATVPAGAFSGPLLKWEVSGSVGPASVNNTQYRLFARGVGGVANVESEDVSAFLVYNNDTIVGKVLFQQ